jgi:hypothetical protein
MRPDVFRHQEHNRREIVLFEDWQGTRVRVGPTIIESEDARIRLKLLAVSQRPEKVCGIDHAVMSGNVLHVHSKGTFCHVHARVQQMGREVAFAVLVYHPMIH